MAGKQIWVVDDDVYIGDMLEELLTREGYQVYRAYSGTEVLLLLSNTRPDLVLLDLMLPGLSGEEVLPRLCGIPVIVISAKIDIDNKVELLLGGAADYVTKPFDNKELLARIVVQLRKVEAGDGERKKSLIFEEIKMDLEQHAVWVNGASVKLTRTEYAILKLLMQNPSQVITKAILLERIREDTPDCLENSLKVHVSNLRKKLRDSSGKEYIEAVWGIGFKMMRG